MDNWKLSLDKYLTTPPQEMDDGYWEEVCEKFTDEFWETHSEMVEDGKLDMWILRCRWKSLSPSQSAHLIERAVSLHLSR